MTESANQRARRAAIAEAVWSLLEDGGVEGITVREVARRAGVSTGALAHYFSSKDELLTYAVDLAFDRAAGRILDAAEIEPAFDALRAISLEDLPLDAGRRSETHAWLFFWSRAASEPSLAADHRRRYKRWRAMIEQVIARGQADGSIRADCEPTIESELFTSFLDGLALHALTEPSRLRRRAIIAAVDAYLERLAPPPDDP